MTSTWVLVAVMTIGEAEKTNFKHITATSMAVAKSAHPDLKQCLEEKVKFYDELVADGKTNGGVECVKVSPKIFRGYK